jgi:AcrR family transcriptional regulator
LRAARIVFSERGYEGATFQAIAVRADLTRPAINHYFSSKRVLYREVLSQTSELVFGAGLAQAARETTLMAKLTGFISAAVAENYEHTSASAFLISAILESQRHPELGEAENDAVRICREFLTDAVSQAIEQGEFAVHVDAVALVETLVVVLLGVGFYAGYESFEAMESVTGMLGQLLDGALFKGPGPRLETAQ